MSFLHEEKDSRNLNIGEKEIKFSFDFKALFLPIMQKNRRSLVFGVFLLLFHFLTLFALQIKSNDFPISTGLMPSIHFVAAKFNIIFLLSDIQTRIMVMLAIFGFNVVYMLSMVLLGFCSGLQRKHILRVVLTKFHVHCFQIYNWSIMVISMHVSSNALLSDSCTDYCKICDFINLGMTIVIANFIEYARININFKCEDSLDSRVDIIDRILINFKLFVVVSSGVQFYIDYWLLLLFFLLLMDYMRKVNYYIEKVSHFYLACIVCFFFVDVIYIALYHNYFNMKMVDISYILLFGCSFLLKTSLHTRGFLIIHKLKRIAKVGIKSKLDFDIYIREIYANLNNFTTNLEAKILFLSFFSMHQNKCQTNDCVCHEVTITNKTNYLRTKKTFKKVVEIYFLEYLSTVSTDDFEDVFLMYCSFITNILKIPSKALKLLVINKTKIISLKNRILIEILVKKSKKSLEKKLLNNDQYAQSFSTVIFFDHQIRTLESNLKHIILKELKIGGILLNEIDSTAKSFDSFVELGSQVNISIDESKEQTKKLFDINVNSMRLIQMTTLIIKYLSEDMSFRNFYKQLNIKRINQTIQKRKKKDLKIDLFDNDGGVIFISLGKDAGKIKKISKNTPKIFGCEAVEMKSKNINEFMPLAFSGTHNVILSNFVNTGKATLLVSGTTQLYGLTKKNLLLHINIIMRLDTFFTKDFMIGAFIKTMRNTNSKTILIDIHGNFLNCSKEVSNFLDFNHLSPEIQHSISMILLIPDIMEKMLPAKFEDVLLKKNTDFKMKGFLLAPIEITEKTVENISIKKEIYPSFKIFEESGNSNQKFFGLRNEVALKTAALIPQEFKFYRIHFTLIIQNFRSNLVNTRLIEIFDILEITDFHLQVQYLTKKTKEFKGMLPPDEIVQNRKASLEIDNDPLLVAKTLMKGSTVNVKDPKLPSNSRLLTIEKEEEKFAESYLSATNRSEMDKKLQNLGYDPLKPPSESLFPQKSSDAGHVPKIGTIPPIMQSELESEIPDKSPKSRSVQGEGSSQQNLLAKPSSENMAKSLSTIEQQEEGSISFDQGGRDFEEKISQMSNELLRRESEEQETIEDDISHTHGGSQVSRVSSHASGDGKKSTLEILVTVGVQKIIYLRVLNVMLFILFFTVTVAFFVLIRNESYNLETTLKNSGTFHNQVSPLCILVRDSSIMTFLYGGEVQLDLAKETELITEIKSSIDFNNILLSRAYKNGIAQADSTVDFVYTQFVNVSIENITMFTNLLNNSSDQFIKHQVPIKLLPNNLLYVEMNIPQCILFFLSAAEHFYYAEVMGDVQNATDSQNYIFFLEENILKFIRSMLNVLDTNKDKISGSVSYLKSMNLAFFLITLFAILYGIGHSCYISIKSKFKANKFCSLFFSFQEKEIEDRSNKLRFVMDRYFSERNALFATDISSFNKVSQSKHTKAGDIISTDKINLLRSENPNAKTRKRHRSKRTVVINQLKGRKFQIFLVLFLFISIIIATGIVGLYLSNYLAVDSFASNVIEITGDLESVESYVLTLHIQYAANSILLGLFNETAERKKQKMDESNALLDIVDSMQSSITDLGSLFKVSNNDHILTQLKYEFFTKDICELYSLIKQDINNQPEEVQEIANRLKGITFCQQLLKNVMTKGCTSFAFEINEIFKQWQDFMRQSNFSSTNLISIIKTQEFLDINYALPYIYALGLYDMNLMMTASENYFLKIRNEQVVWFVITLIFITLLLSIPYQKLIQHLNTHSNACFQLIKIFPSAMISNNKLLENKISRITKQQKI